MPTYPLPTAEPDEIRRVVALYRREYGVDLTFDEAKDLLERVMHFAYLTEVEAALDGLREAGDDGGGYHAPVVDGPK